MPKQPLSMIATNPVLADRAGDFEDWLRTVLVRATRDHRPELLDRWEVLRAAKEKVTISYAHKTFEYDVTQLPAAQARFQQLCNRRSAAN